MKTLLAQLAFDGKRLVVRNSSFITLNARRILFALYQNDDQRLCN